METREETHTSPLASLLPVFHRPGQAQLPMDPQGLRRILKRIFHSARYGPAQEADVKRLGQLLNQDVTSRVANTISLVEDDQMHAIAFVFDDASVYVAVRLPNERLFSFARPSLDTARDACSFFHPAVTRAEIPEHIRVWSTQLQ